MVSTADFPQADKLDQVGHVALAVAKGNHADKDIENFIGLASRGRQGRYYRLAAEILGLITTDQNYSVLTPLGQEYASLGTPAARLDFLARCLLETTVFQQALHYIHQHKPSDHQLQLWFRSFYPGAPNTANRRFSTFQNYLRDAQLIQHVGANNQVIKYAGAVVKQTKSIKDGLAGKPVKKSFVDALLGGATGTIKVEIDAQKRERANQMHWNLVTAKAAFLDARGLPAFENEQIDLFTESGKDSVLYEMKSVGEENFISQIRKAIAQLYEYRYVFSEPKARLCIVTNSAITKSDDWLVDYLVKDRSIAYEWTDDFKTFQCHKDSKALLQQFAP